MTATTVPQPINFTRTDLNAAVNAALAKVTDNRWTRATMANLDGVGADGTNRRLGGGHTAADLPGFDW